MNRILVGKTIFSCSNVRYKIFARFLSKKNEDHEGNVNYTRNIGVMAHVDAGKTTTTERMLFYSGYTNSIGNVDDGNTVMDYMDQERERGITITSAAITFPWKDYRFNLIDTPGHIDFSFEVERSLRVLDGAITIIDASAGVEAQTITVWRQSNKYKIPRIVFVNKMDKANADFDESIHSIEKKLNTIPITLQMPIVAGSKSFSGLIDLINMRKLTWENEKSKGDYGKTYKITSLAPSDELYERAFRKRLTAIEKLAQVNEQFAEHLLEKYNLNYEKVNDNIALETYIRQACLNCSITPVLCGSSLRNVGVQPLMDAVIKYLPSPLDLKKNNFKKYYDNSLVAICFKIIHDHQKSRKRVDSSTAIASLQSKASSSLNKSKGDEQDDDILSFVRVYNGELSAKSKVFNANKQIRENCDKLYIPYSNQIKQASKITAGNIAIINGFVKTTTGDFLIGSKQAYEQADKKFSQETDDENVQLMKTNVDITPPVYFCTVEPESDAEEKRLQFALECLQREDPSLRVIFNDAENLGQTILQGMGELHLDIIKDRILREYKLKVYFGPLNIAYREVPTKDVSETFNFDKSLGEKKINVQIALDIKPRKDFTFKSVKLVNSGENNFDDLPADVLASIDHGVRSALNKGVVLRNPIIDTEVYLTSFVSNRNASLAHVSSAAFTCTMNALKNADCVIIQPIMKLDITTSKEYSSSVHNDLARRNATNIQLNETNQSQNVHITARVPLSKLTSYSSEIRKITSGNTNFTIEYDSYENLTQKEYQELLAKKKF